MLGQCRQRLFQQSGEPTEVPGSVGAVFRFQFRRIAEPGEAFEKFNRNVFRPALFK